MIKKLIAAVFAVTVLALPVCALAEDSSVSTPNISVTTTTGSATFTLRSDSKGAKIYYTTNGSDPTTSSKKYSSSVKVTSSCEVRAVAYDGGEYSPVGYYTVTVTKARAATPTFKSTNVDGGKKVTITSSGSTIYYTTDGSTPTTSDKRYSSSGIVVSESCYIKAIAVRSSYQNSPVAVAYVDIPQFTGKPDARTTVSGSTTTVKLSGPSSNCTYYYTTDGSDPVAKASGSCKKYTSSGIRITKACTLKLIVCKPGYAPSRVYTAEINGPTCAEVTATQTAVDGGIKVTLRSATSGATIYYTIDGGTPTIDDYKYTSSGIIIDQPGTTYIRAIAVKSGYEDSEPARFPITMTLVTSYNSTTNKKVKLTGTSGSYIYYTTDGDDPTTKDKKVSSGSSITIPNNCVLKIMAAKKGYAPSEVETYTLSYNSKVATPTASDTKYTDYTRVTLRTSTSGATIFYTLDGSDPRTYGTVYRSSIQVEYSCILRAVAVKDGYDDSDILVHNVTVKGNGDGVIVLGGYGEDVKPLNDSVEPTGINGMTSQLNENDSPDFSDADFPEVDGTETTVWNDTPAVGKEDVPVGVIDLS